MSGGAPPRPPVGDVDRRVNSLMSGGAPPRPPVYRRV